VLTEIVDLAIDDAGSVYLAQWGQQKIQIFDHAGRFVRTIGRTGQGPGEFLQLASVGWAGDTLWAIDSGNNRISYFRPNGEFVRSVNFTALTRSGEHSAAPLPLAVLADGSVVGMPRIPADFLSGGIVESIPMLRSNRSAEQLDTLAWVSVTHHVLEMRPADDIRMFGLQPLSDHDLFDVFPEGSGLVLVERRAAERSDFGHIRVTKLAITGDTVFSRAYAYRPIPVGEGLIDSLVSIQVAARPHGMSAVRYAAAVRGALYIPKYRPPVKKVLTGRDHTIWLEREGEESASARWTVLNPTGELVAVVDVPVELVLLHVQADLVWGVEHDSLDVPYLVRCRVRRK
jgi:hypothetical protein